MAIKNSISCFLMMAIVFLMFGCAQIKSGIILPVQDINVSPDDNMLRVIFYNSSSHLLYPTIFTGTSGAIDIKIDGKYLGRLKKRQYVQVFLERGNYDVSLKHRDILRFKTDHKLELKNDNTYIEVFARPVSNKFKIVEFLPVNFSRKYKPAYVLHTEN